MTKLQLDNSDSRREDRKVIKCVVWDLDNTLWEGVLLEDESVFLREEVVSIIKELDNRGILQSIASKNDHEMAMAKLGEVGLLEYFLYPQINWSSKSASIEAISKSINLGLDAVAFIDDQPFEIAEVAFSHPEVLCIGVDKLDGLLDMLEMTPRFITQDSKVRRLMYISDQQRNRAEEVFSGPKEAFLATLDMVCTISLAKEEDLMRAEELTVRTNQLNATGYTYSYSELNQLRQSDDHMLLIASLEDRFGSYGKIGLALIECQKEVWTLKLLLMSCRVMSRGIGTIMMTHIMMLARDKCVRLLAEFVPTDRNRMMYITYKFAGFTEISKGRRFRLLENDLTRIPPFPEYVRVNIESY